MVEDNAEIQPVPKACTISIRGLTKSFGAHRALRGVNLDIAAGESVAIFGSNGAGKTTLIKILATIMHPSSGSIMVDGLDIKKNAETARRKIGIVTHQTFLYNHLTATENLEFYGRMYDVPRRKERIEEMLDLVGMAHRRNDRIEKLSRGMQQRVSIARALMHKPGIILLDEPETGLDQQAKRMLKDALWKESDPERVIIQATHNMEDAAENCRRVFILARGEIAYEQQGQDIDITGLRQAYLDHTEVMK